MSKNETPIPRPSSGGRYVRVDGELLTRAEYEARQKAEKTPKRKKASRKKQP